MCKGLRIAHTETRRYHENPQTMVPGCFPKEKAGTRRKDCVPLGFTAVLGEDRMNQEHSARVRRQQIPITHAQSLTLNTIVFYVSKYPCLLLQFHPELSKVFGVDNHLNAESLGGFIISGGYYLRQRLAKYGP